jgi:hypothetical protein
MKHILDLEMDLGAGYVNRQSVTIDNVRLSLTPFDIPRSARVTWDEQCKSLTIEFQYLTPDEPKGAVRVNRDVEMSTGKFSHKFYGAIVSHANSVIEATHKLTAALEEIRRRFDVQKPQQRIPYWNYSLARDFLSFEEQRLSTLDLSVAR